VPTMITYTPFSEAATCTLAGSNDPEGPARSLPEFPPN
jgi:hypothetical protein